MSFFVFMTKLVDCQYVLICRTKIPSAHRCPSFEVKISYFVLSPLAHKYSFNVSRSTVVRVRYWRLEAFNNTSHFVCSHHTIA